ncbi:MAG TPA: hypothetical protein VMB51_05205 [Solirubrobacteraceae bacterium]|nr:hypothetical protein [Solirubrobacteraceae bacterium]
MSTAHLILWLALAGVCMVVSDVLATVMVEAQATYRRHLSAALDTIGWVVAITTTEYSLRLLDSHSTAAHVYCYVCVSAANYYGTWLGVGWGAKLTSRRPERGGPLTELIVRHLNPNPKETP